MNRPRTWVEILIALLLGLLLISFAIALWALWKSESTSDPRYLSIVVWVGLVWVAIVSVFRVGRQVFVALAFGPKVLGRSIDAKAGGTQAAPTMDEPLVRDALERCKAAQCPAWIWTDVGAWLDAGRDDSTRRRELLERLYRYSAFSPDPYEQRKAANDVRLAINGTARDPELGSEMV